MILPFVKILIGLAGLSLVVVIHEAGHFIAARLCKIKVEAFSIGWGKILWTKGWKGTEFRISLFPLGGYCKMQGEQALIQAWESKARRIETKAGDMYGAAWWQRVIVSSSGPLMNLFFAFLIFFFIALIGYNMDYYPSRIVLASRYTERQNYPANQAGLKSGDRILSINGRDIERFDQIQQIVSSHPEETLQLKFARAGKILETAITPELLTDSARGSVGIYPWIEPRIQSLEENPLLQKQGLKPGDRITAINGRPVTQMMDLYPVLNDKAPVESLTLEDPKGHIRKLASLNIPPSALKGLEFAYRTRRRPGASIPEAFAEGFRETGQTILSSLKGLGMLFKGVDLQSAVSGPLRITYMTGELAFSGFQKGAGKGLLHFFRFLALINIALFIMNLLPIPVLDGGQILLFLIEGLLKAKPNPAVIYRYQITGTIIVLGLILFATTNDILFFTRR